MRIAVRLSPKTSFYDHQKLRYLLRVIEIRRALFATLGNYVSKVFEFYIPKLTNNRLENEGHRNVYRIKGLLYYKYI